MHIEEHKITVKNWFDSRNIIIASPLEMCSTVVWPNLNSLGHMLKLAEKMTNGKLLFQILGLANDN